MKWTIIGLVFVGIIAAISASILAVTLKANVGRGSALPDPGTQEIEILVAARALPAMSRIEGDAVATQRVRRSEAPVKALTSTSQVIGQVLIVPVLAGQAFVSSQFASAESGLQVATVLPEGSRAMSVMLSDETGIEPLLYPGSIVDIVASMRLATASGNQSAEAVSVTVLQGIQVLAVGGRSIVSDETEAAGANDFTNRRGRMVTLMVTTAQAEMLQLASTQGKITVALRNPLDRDINSSRGTRISDLNKDLAKRIADLAQSEVSTVPLTPPAAGNVAAPAPGPQGNAQAGSAATADGMPAEPAEAVAMAAAPKPAPQWITTILRGRAKEIQRFPMPEEDVAK